MNILVLGSGGREHALCWKLAQSPHTKKLFCAPGNPGIAQLATCVPHAATDIAALVNFAREQSIDLTVVGPEQPLAAGVVDAFRSAGLRIFGPTQAATQLESSKVFSKQFMQQHHIPTAQFSTFTDAAAATHFLATANIPIVIKQDGLAAGKGVIVATTREDALDAVQQFGASADAPLVIEKFLAGEEISCIAVVDGERYVLLAPSQDHKRLRDGDQGPNTGGMGAVSPVKLWSKDLEQKVCRHVIEPVISGLRAAGTPFTGFLYAGLMIVDGQPYVLEFNTRLGDPETQVILPRLRSDLVTLLTYAADGQLPATPLDWNPQTCICVVLASHGYPSTVRTGDVITGIETAAAQKDVHIFHAGTSLTLPAPSTPSPAPRLLTAGGRVLGVTALGENITIARETTYAAVSRLAWDGMQYRSDIGGRQANQELRSC